MFSACISKIQAAMSLNWEPREAKCESRMNLYLMTRIDPLGYVVCDGYFGVRRLFLEILAGLPRTSMSEVFDDS